VLDHRTLFARTTSEPDLRTFQSALRTSDFVVSVEPVLRADRPGAYLRDIARKLSGQVDAVQYGVDRYASGPLSPLAAASILIGEGVDTVVRLSCRDRNRVALQSELLGAAAIGVTSLLLERGRKLPDSLKGKVKGVFDTTPENLLGMAAQLTDAVEGAKAMSMALGSSVTVIEPRKKWKGKRLLKKIDAGASFLQTQPCLNPYLVRKYMEAVVALRITHRASMLVEVPLLSSVAEAKALKAADTGALLPPPLIQRLGDAANPEAEGEAICVEVASEIMRIPGVSGINISFSGAIERVLSVLGQLERPDR
jgi:methylenetetrahydrofolate reductase (NADPH)